MTRVACLYRYYKHSRKYMIHIMVDTDCCDRPIWTYIVLRNSLTPVGEWETNNLLHRQHTHRIGTCIIIGICTYVFYFVFSSIPICFRNRFAHCCSPHPPIRPYQLALKFAAPTSRIFPCYYYYYYIIKTRPFYDSRSLRVYRVVWGRKNYNALRRNPFLCERL